MERSIRFLLAVLGIAVLFSHGIDGAQVPACSSVSVMTAMNGSLVVRPTPVVSMQNLTCQFVIKPITSAFPAGLNITLQLNLALITNASITVFRGTGIVGTRVTEFTRSVSGVFSVLGSGSVTILLRTPPMDQNSSLVLSYGVSTFEIVQTTPMMTLLAPLLCGVAVFILSGSICCCVYHGKCCRKSRGEVARPLDSLAFTNPLYARRPAAAVTSNPLVRVPIHVSAGGAAYPMGGTPTSADMTATPYMISEQAAMGRYEYAMSAEMRQHMPSQYSSAAGYEGAYMEDDEIAYGQPVMSQQPRIEYRRDDYGRMVPVEFTATGEAVVYSPHVSVPTYQRLNTPTIVVEAYNFSEDDPQSPPDEFSQEHYESQEISPDGPYSAEERANISLPNDSYVISADDTQGEDQTTVTGVPATPSVQETCMSPVSTIVDLSDSLMLTPTSVPMTPMTPMTMAGMTPSQEPSFSPMAVSPESPPLTKFRQPVFHD